MEACNQSNTGKQYFCTRPVSEACKRGFLRTASYTQHKNVKHAPASRLHHSPMIPDAQYMPDNDNDHQLPPPEGAYFTKHPVLDGVYKISCFGSGQQQNATR